ncbi:hypothetical protein ACH4U5_37655 [Streptomyces sp. NPDC020858]|uniref:hypothetical protein n=1 Tax=Streptomyces sp. NPDC020858 TaxID=3365097 RepID=UPI00378FB475
MEQSPVPVRPQHPLVPGLLGAVHAQGFLAGRGEVLRELPGRLGAQWCRAADDAEAAVVVGLHLGRWKLINQDPHGEGWLIEISLTNPSSDDLMSAEEYNAFITPEDSRVCCESGSGVVVDSGGCLV